MKKNFIFLGLFLFLMSCQDDAILETITVDNKYSLDVFTNMSKSTELNDEASLQYQNIFKQLYVVVIDESADQFENIIVKNQLQDDYSADLDGYTKLIVNGFDTDSEIQNHSEPKDITINGLDAKLFEFNGRVNDYDIYYKLAFVKTKKSYYQIMTWTLLDNKEKLKEKMDKMIYSFKEIRSKTVAKKN